MQGTPDLLPSDVTGSSVLADGGFRFIPGPIFTNVLLVDEINRATPRTQSALLEAMQERQVSVDGETRPIPAPFLVLATQNPIELEGTFALPEAQLDRFLVRIVMGYPDEADERSHRAPLPRGARAARGGARRCSIAATLPELRDATRRVTVSDEVEGYLVRIVRATREHPDLQLGASPRASVALYRAAQARRLLEGRDFVLPDDVAALAGAGADASAGGRRRPRAARRDRRRRDGRGARAGPGRSRRRRALSCGAASMSRLDPDRPGAWWPRARCSARPGLLLIGGLTLLSRWLTTLWSRYGLDAVGYERRIGTTRAVWGDQVPLDVEVWNRKLLPLPLLTADDHVTDTLRVVGKPLVASDRPGQGALQNSWSLLWYERVVRHLGDRRAAARRVHVRPGAPHRQRPLRARHEQRGARAARPSCSCGRARCRCESPHVAAAPARDGARARQPLHRSVALRRRAPLPARRPDAPHPLAGDRPASASR